jgi:hypothetical protein
MRMSGGFLGSLNLRRGTFLRLQGLTKFLPKGGGARAISVSDCGNFVGAFDVLSNNRLLSLQSNQKSLIFVARAPIQVRLNLLIDSDFQSTCNNTNRRQI